MAEVARTLAIWGRLLSASLRGQLSYRRSFLLETVGRFGLTAIELGAVLALFEQVPDLAGWTRWEVVYLYGVASMALGLGELVTDGVNDMPELVRLGTLDALLVRPVPALVQVLGRQCRPFHLGRFLQGALATGAALWQLGWTPDAVTGIMPFVNVASMATVFAALFVLGGGLVVLTVQKTEAMNAFTYGGVQMAQYPLPVYRPWMQALFLFVVPVGFTAYFPATVVLGKPDALGLGAGAAWLAPLVSLAFLGAAIGGWSLCLQRYRSTGS